ncbi:MAG TPA: 7-cyano-7-deazaguanine synthase QueC [Elusimicrobia bacterium]|nr:MAG: 7-cyano-7-deazaguanine synthase QueC [Elusimicrobia bacterium RIFOXYA12_FULL_49_49]OGS10472.1 MAG: 7-cyano-7-deazaguanine synthase QueC [Elusimicrobia bacterium RIFOXYB1_FULL_48_9]OGS14695.1 MAG: 7-cyano-7-deazaguanine synthase QueC [Elusimicrobia bacterium RIFOXYA2_FULL_47_53]OGS25653.1 MAG: 7-cyano-7-deazaguanine synthase QueC [Elusimicrobia bacterium RIFOXYB12_FULL_50_12]OGS31786.1 MAG: 7-cyano-7-deazaguanine synthase QueC [Elusimicrobia bacterium RIFOXYB2_FULL_46_23]HBU69682.1 7-cy
MRREKAVVLLSGGLDSATVLRIALRKYECFCVIFDYGQKHRVELKSAVKIARSAGCGYDIIKINLPWGGSSLLKKKTNLPEKNKLPLTYVPGRNTIFLSFALSLAEARKASAIFIGANALDYPGYPDCRPKYIEQWNRLIKSLGLKIKVFAPLVKLSKKQIIRLGVKLGVPYELTWSCYAGGKKPCLKCDSCRFRQKGFAEAGLKDPALG